MIDGYHYFILDGTEQRALLAERLHQAEADHYRASIELRLAGVMNLDADQIAFAQHQLDCNAVQIEALRSWLGFVGEVNDAEAPSDRD